MKSGEILFTLFVNSYSLITDFARIALFPLLRGVSERRNWDLDKRQKLPSAVRDIRGRRVVWLHASSLGEAKLLVKFAAMLRQRHDDDLYLVTATTRNGVEFLEKNRHPSFCAIGFQPIDSITMVRHVVEHYHVTRLWLIETELWPSMLLVCMRCGIPVGIVNGRIEERSFGRYRRLQAVVRPLLAPLDIVLAQSDAYAARFVELGARRDVVHVVGNIKGHVRIERPHKQEWLAVRRELNIDEQSFVVTAGCVHRGEGKALRAFFNRIEQLGYPCRMVVVPRYCHEAADILEELGGTVLHLTGPSTARRWNICIVAATGILDNMYMAADAAVIGGTFDDTGGHNMWDAARFGIPVFFGPDYHTQQESGETLLNAGVGFCASGGEDLADLVFDVVKGHPMRFYQAQAAFIEATNRAGSVLEPLLP
jgi:3-deoxy-D-manno-octulosonic-acid transferase